MSHLEEYNKNAEILGEVLALLPDDNRNKKILQEHADALKVAAEKKDLSETEQAFLEMLSNTYMRQSIFAAYDLGVLTEDVEKKWRGETRSILDAEEDWNAEAKKLTAEEQEISKQIEAFNAKKNALGVFQSVATGRSKSFEEAEKKSEEYNARSMAQ